jgi:hypothetical protein
MSELVESACKLPIHLVITATGGNGRKTIVVPAKAGTQWRWFERRWIPAFAGMTG